MRGIRVEINKRTGKTGQTPTFATAVAAYCTVNGTRSIAIDTGDRGTTRQDTFSLIFDAGPEYGEIKAASGLRLELTPGSRIKFSGRYYYVLRVDPKINEKTNRVRDVFVYCEDGGKSA